jgi:FGGY-family pentulose kinase
MTDLVAAVDVGTGSARAGIFDAAGRMLGRAEHPIDLHRPAPDQAEQDSEQIWEAACAAVRAACGEAGAAPAAIAGIAFDATCSLVVRDAAGRPLPVSTTGDPRWDTLLWLDHRAQAEAAECTATGHPVVARDGGAVSPEMQVPKLMWLKRHLPGTWLRAARVFDLSDFLAWRACGATERSVCTLACKWTYQAHLPAPWQPDFLASIGLDDLFARTGAPQAAVPVGTDLGPLSPDAARELGVTTRCRVAAGLIDAHAGALGSLAAFADAPAALARRLALIAGTSNCVMAFGSSGTPRRGVWGPHRGAILPDLWVSEGGQSAAGGLLDHLCRTWGGVGEPAFALHARICARIAELRARDGWDLAAGLHVVPDFAGNRSPLADPAAAGVISGLTLDPSFDGFCRLYWRTAVGIALGLRQIVALLTGEPGARPDLHLAGGHTRSPLLTGLYASATGCRVIVADDADAVLLGTAMGAAAGAGLHPGLVAAATAMAPRASEHLPDPAAQLRLERDYAIFLELQHHRCAIAAGSAAPGAAAASCAAG